MSKLHDLNQLGQSIWLDNMRRALLDHGDLQKLIDQGVTGVTANPSIFEKAIAGSADYDDALRQLVDYGLSVEGIYEALVLEDIGRAADLFRPRYDRTGGRDGFVSLEVSPTLAHDTEGSIAEARHLFAALNRPNVMIKIPATPAGIPAIETLTSEGINVNITLIFSLAQYEAVVEAYLAGLEKLVASGGDPGRVASVASFFVSRVDSVVDAALEATDDGRRPTAGELKGKIAIANARVAYGRFEALFSTARWRRLAEHGARVQRPLWASTGTKNPLYPDTLYVDALIGADTVNTAPPSTLQAFLEHGTVAVTLTKDAAAEARRDLERLAEMGIDLDAITQRLLEEGLASFDKSFDTLMASIGGKRERLLAGEEYIGMKLGRYQAAVDAALRKLRDDDIMARIWAHDHTVWKPEPTEITNRLGWLHSPEKMSECVAQLEAFAASVRADGYTDVLLLGMGGSSLAPELFSKVFGDASAGTLALHVLDSTDPGAVLAYAEKLDPARTLYIVSSKSGGTVETFSFFKFFYTQVVDALGEEEAGRHFVAITDPGSGLAETAAQYRFRATFLNDPDIGGRYSVLSHFGLVPAALVGVDVAELLEKAMTLAVNADACNCPVAGDNQAARLGVIMGELARRGRDKVTFVTSPAIASFGDWVEQLIAESTGKEGKGILPVVGEPLGAPELYGDDRLFVYLHLGSWDDPQAMPTIEALMALEEAGHPAVMIQVKDVYRLGAQFFLWEMATAVAGHVLGINPFDQPNVESAKVLARKLVAEFKASGRLPEVEPAPLTADALRHFLGQARPGDYVALQAYARPTVETGAALLALRTRLRDETRLATTVGYGPRFLHSTGQLHKGDGGNGLFIQFTADDGRDAPIPDTAGEPYSSMTFGILKAAQALGDRQVLLDGGRRVIRFHLGEDVVDNLKRLVED